MDKELHFMDEHSSTDWNAYKQFQYFYLIYAVMSVFDSVWLTFQKLIYKTTIMTLKQQAVGVKKQ